MTTTREIVELCNENIDNMELALETQERGFVADNFRKWIPIYRSIRARLEAAEKMAEALRELNKQEHERGGSLGNNGYFHYRISGHIFERSEKALSAWEDLG